MKSKTNLVTSDAYESNGKSVLIEARVKVGNEELREEAGSTFCL